MHNNLDQFDMIEYAKQVAMTTRFAEHQYQHLDRDFHLQLKRDVIDAEALDHSFTRLVALTDNLIYEYRLLSKLILERE